MSASELRLRAAGQGDLSAIVALHFRSYSKSHFTSRLPRAALERYYGLFVSDGAETLLLEASTADGGTELLGFAVFGTDISARIARFKRDNANAIIATAARHPLAAAEKAARALWARLMKTRPMAPAPHLLLSIAVSRPGRGLGGRLLKATIAAVQSHGAERIGLYVNTDNIGAINCYVAQGFGLRELHGNQYYMDRELRLRHSTPSGDALDQR